AFASPAKQGTNRQDCRCTPKALEERAPRMARVHLSGTTERGAFDLRAPRHSAAPVAPFRVCRPTFPRWRGGRDSNHFSTPKPSLSLPPQSGGSCPAGLKGALLIQRRRRSARRRQDRVVRGAGEPVAVVVG